MNNLDTHSRMSKVYTILRLVTTIFSIFCPIAMICSAIVISLREGDWWLNLFAANLAGILMIFGTIYLSLLTLMKEATRYIGNKKRDFSDTPITKWIHRLLIGAAIAGVISFIPIFLILYDVVSGGFAIIHFICGGAIVVLYFTLGINVVIHRKKHLEN